MPIKALDPKVVARIAAGEVVERPASVVKELVENALDAGSSQISVEVRGGGVSLIKVADNGSGIASAEVELAFDRYATSKLENLDDLESIQSLGFRGEALPSITAVAQVDMVTCAAGERAGTYLALKDGAIASRSSQGRPQGTTVTVANLFRKIPARLKFLKSVATENAHIANVVSQYALAFPEVRFSLSIDGRAALRTSGSGRLIDSIVEVYGAEVADSMIELKGEAAMPQVTGRIGSPKVNRSGRGYLSFFVNRRWVNSRLLARAVEEAYHGLLMVGRHPITVINISLPLNEVDVNIHPTKSEVKFANERAIFSAVQRAVRQALTEQIAVPRVEAAVTRPVFPSAVRETATIPYSGVAPGPAFPPPTPSMALPVLRVLGQLDNSYIIAEGPDGLYLIDQHAAHERILFERISQQRLRREVEVQGMLEPMTLEVSPRQEAVLRSRYQDLNEFGFAIEPFGDKTFLVRAVPALLHKEDWAGMLRELLDSLSEGDKGDWAEEVTISMACHSAVRAGQSLSDAEMQELVRQLEQSDTPHTCPHGRPTMIHLSSEQLKKQFGRT
ncbi:MAG TPA: DNA mismatch repair endonuclease MutL [Dehalococcoidia bacterium]|nr:DNA mismatch repair endonuclease MutL [Dehalococcoidia bacterium]